MKRESNSKKNKKRHYLFLAYALSFFSMIVPLVVSAASYNYRLMEKIPGFEDIVTGPDQFVQYITAIYKFGIWTVGIAALFMLTFGGFMYMTSAGNTSRVESAKKTVWSSIFGLIVALSAYLILYIINPDLIRVDLGRFQ